YGFLVLGEWDEVLEMAHALPREAAAHNRVAVSTYLLLTPFIPLARAEIEVARDDRSVYGEMEGTADLQEQAILHASDSLFAMADGRHEDAIASAWEAIDLRGDVGILNESVKE